jgi:hypothetical protein
MILVVVPVMPILVIAIIVAMWGNLYNYLAYGEGCGGEKQCATNDGVSEEFTQFVTLRTFRKHAEHRSGRFERGGRF